MRDDNRKILTVLVLVLLVCILVIFWLFASRDRYENEGDALIARFKYEEALDKYIRASRRYTFGGKERILFKIGQTYEQLRDFLRALDIYFQILRDYEGTEWYDKARSRIQEIHAMLDRGDGMVQIGQADTRLGKARNTYRCRYKLLMAQLLKNKSGVSGRLREAYEKYRESFEAYQKLIRTEYKKAVQKRLEQRNSSHSPTEDGD